ncbi:hypothetical protein GAO09_23005 [Rhizobiales bacterium RZME27]|uniref:Uncharacterized protein n=1 Tax=Endobacterium cereale TaxID=2663029 RepID=A0A6A8AGA7_9HYPH|nr:hypothetical protein [Endobacterium cereale]MEB2845463.1 hypothetical protein [Endobacterium cereale]MQY48908.1 hypothetical protein [Endobacterium cereale]
MKIAIPAAALVLTVASLSTAAIAQTGTLRNAVETGRSAAASVGSETDWDQDDDWAEEDSACSFNPGFQHGIAFGERAAFLRDHYNPVRIRVLIASGLSIQETTIGIRTDQQDSWRAYTSAVLAMVPEQQLVSNLFGKEGENPAGPDAFARPEAFADMLLASSAKAETLKRAIADLRAKLSPEQLEAARLPRLIGWM